MNIDELDDQVLTDIMRACGFEPDDEAGYERVKQMGAYEAFRKWCQWHGLLGDLPSMIINAYSSIRKASGRPIE